MITWRTRHTLYTRIILWLWHSLEFLRYFFFLPASCATVLCEALAVPSSLAGFAGRSIAVALLSAAWYCGQAAGGQSPQRVGLRKEREVGNTGSA
eukprot:6352993-Amphidinium_carterae.1